MEKKENLGAKSNVISGISSTAGAAVGVVAGSMISSEINAAEIPEATVEEQDVEVVNAEPSYINDTHGQQGMQLSSQQEPTSQQEPAKFESEPDIVTPNGSGSPDKSDDIDVLGYETITDNDSNEMDVAVVNAHGQEILIVDVDQDGTADLMASDLNNNGRLENNEVVDVSGENIAMQPFEEAANANNMMAQTDDIDYVNNADVNDYMA